MRNRLQDSESGSCSLCISAACVFSKLTPETGIVSIDKYHIHISSIHGEKSPDFSFAARVLPLGVWGYVYILRQNF